MQRFRHHRIQSLIQTFYPPRQRFPVAACAVSLTLVPAIIIAAGIMSLKHKQKLKAD